MSLDVEIVMNCTVLRMVCELDIVEHSTLAEVVARPLEFEANCLLSVCLWEWAAVLAALWLCVHRTRLRLDRHHLAASSRLHSPSEVTNFLVAIKICA